MDFRCSAVPGIFLEFQDSLESSAPDPGKETLGQMYSQPGRLNPPSKEVIPPRKIKPSSERSIPYKED